MSIKIRMMTKKDKQAVIEMMRVFYASPAVFSNGSEEIFKTDVDVCVSDSPYLEGYVFEDGSNDTLLHGYAMIAKSFSTEFGKPCIWIEDLYIKEDFRGLGIGTLFLEYVEEKYCGSLFRLEVEPDNEKAVSVYKKRGFDFLPYSEMKK